MKFALLTLGCDKNTVDSERYTAELVAHGAEPAQSPAEADVILVNTCGFIDAAKAESIEELVRAASCKEHGEARLVALTSAGAASLYDVSFQPGDILLMGRESSGLPDDLHARADLRVRIPMTQGFRSLNLAVASGIALGEAMRQTALLPQ